MWWCWIVGPILFILTMCLVLCIVMGIGIITHRIGDGEWPEWEYANRTEIFFKGVIVSLLLVVLWIIIELGHDLCMKLF
jgi:hypothetical protein